MRLAVASSSARDAACVKLVKNWLLPASPWMVYLRGAIEAGLTRAQITEAFTHLAFYAGWARATNAMTALTRPFGK